MVSSVVGFYSLRAFAQLTPRKDDTTMTTVRMELKDRVRGEVGGEGAEIPPGVLKCLRPPCVSSISSFLSRLPPLQTPTAHC